MTSFWNSLGSSTSKSDRILEQTRVLYQIRISELETSNDGLQADLQSLAEAKRGGEDEYRAQLAELASQKDDVGREAAQAHAQATKLADDLAQLHQEIAARDAQHSRDLQDAAARESKLQAQTTNLHDNLQASQQREASLQSQLQQLSFELSTIRQQHAALQQQHADAVTEATKLQGDLHDLQNSFQQRILQLEQDQEVAAGQRLAAEAEWTSTRDRLTEEGHAAQAQIAGLQASKEDVQAHVEELGQQLEAESRASASLQEHVASLQDAAASTRRQHEQASKAQQAELHQALHKVEDLHRKAEQSSQQHAQQLTDHSSQISHLQHQVLTVQGQLDAAKSSHAEQHSQVQKQLEDSQKQVETMTSECQQHREQNQGLIRETEALRQECDSLRASQKDKPEHAQQQTHALEQRLAESEAREDDLRQQIEQLQRQSSDQRQPEHPLDEASLVDELMAEVEHLRQEKADVEAQADELASSLAAERRRSEQAGEGPAAGMQSALAAIGGMASSDMDNGNDTDYLSDVRWDALREAGTAAGWLVDPSEIIVGAELGQGSFGTTYRGTWRGGEVAVKSVRISRADEATSFLREVHTLASLRHPNVMPFYGACLVPPKHCHLLCEYLPGGTLTTWLHGNRRQGGRGAPKRSLAEKVRMALGVARGMQALEEAQPPILHRDLKPSNVFIDAGGNARVADMGLARRWEPESAASLTGETGTYHYMAPEMIRHEMYDSRADVYSWGVLFAEVLTQQVPYETMYCTPVQIALAVGDDKLRPSIPSDTPKALTNVAAACFEPEADMRPSFGVIVHHLSKFLAQMPSNSRMEGTSSQPDNRLSRMFGNWAVTPSESSPSPKRGASPEVNGH